MNSLRRWVVLAWIGFLILPWYGLEDGWLSGAWPLDFLGAAAAPAWAQALLHDRGWLLALVVPLAFATVAGPRRKQGAWYGTNASRIAATGVPAVVFGPGSINQAHTVDEWIDVNELRQASEIYYRFCAEM